MSKRSKREPTGANVRAALVELGYDPDAADWPSTPARWSLPGPAWAVTEAITRQLGWSPRLKEPRYWVAWRLARPDAGRPVAPRGGPAMSAVVNGHLRARIEAEARQGRVPPRRRRSGTS